MKHLLLLVPLALAVGPAGPAGPIDAPVSPPSPTAVPTEPPPSGTPPEGGPPVSIEAVIHLPHAVQRLVGAGVPETEVAVILDAAQSSGLTAGAAAILVTETSIQVTDKGVVPNLGAFVVKQLDAGLRGKALVQSIANFHAARGESWDDKPPMGHPDAGRKDKSVAPRGPEGAGDRAKADATAGKGRDGANRDAAGGKEGGKAGGAKEGGKAGGGEKEGGKAGGGKGGRDDGEKGTNRRWEGAR